MKKPPLILTNVLVFIISGAIAFIGVPLWVAYQGIDWAEIGAAIFLFYFTGMSITAGYHRLWSHKTYDANVVVRVILAIGGAMALQNSILHWSSDHRVHHRHVDDNDKDPYSAKKGFGLRISAGCCVSIRPNVTMTTVTVKIFKKIKW